jgi:hypothetical protein
MGMEASTLKNPYAALRDTYSISSSLLLPLNVGLSWRNRRITLAMKIDVEFRRHSSQELESR